MFHSSIFDYLNFFFVFVLISVFVILLFHIHVYRRSVEESLQQYRNEKNRHLMQSSSPQHKLCANDVYDPNQNKYHDGGQILTNNMTTSLSSSVTNVNHGTSNTQSPQSSPYHYHQQQQQSQQQHLHHHLQMHGSDRFSTGSASLNGMMINTNKSNGINVNSNGLSSGVLHPALLNIINEAQGMKFRGKSQTLQIHYLSLG